MPLWNRPFDEKIPLAKVDKYIIAIEGKYPIVGLASFFHIENYLAVQEYGINVQKELVDLALKLGVFVFTNRATNDKSGENFYKERLKKVPKKKSEKEVSEPVKDQIKRTDGKLKVEPILERLLAKELEEYNTFVVENIEMMLMKLAPQANINFNKNAIPYVLTKQNGLCVKELSYIETLSILTEVSLEIVDEYPTLIYGSIFKVLPPHSLTMSSLFILSMDQRCRRSYPT
ncbi:uncharacterized protein NDAI_0J03050 [Naumovozyma dairenensis CBS 421]|uniref:Uncharacterized protein n=1 Tax=Naumovozyma dairenensis (strain ATCC 10597 / BCRC 20456 / CBS 421 / NBRC 0211 / NRRL Y-12639) TaxID=1071378 RepID=G0WHB9_NAUDC|nr:hypothetical protein NDAI_0J03050 [Naumovozyma dairenensis CBS 421]CCD27197.1 hypothetical protein NDAI_0J03050 [Naumovozyma dairenensis CBS 421]